MPRFLETNLHYGISLTKMNHVFLRYKCSNHGFWCIDYLGLNHDLTTVTVVYYVFYKKHDFQNHVYFVITIVLLQ